MFTWICPKCGNEVPPHETDCPRCNKVYEALPAQAAPAAEPPPAPPPVAASPLTSQMMPAAAGPPPPQPPPPPISPATQQYPAQPPPPPPPPQDYARTAYDRMAAPPQQEHVPTYMIPPPQSQGLPSWLVVMMVAAVLIGAGYFGIRYMSSSYRDTQAKATRMSAPEAAGDAATAGAAVTPNAHPLGKHLEISGIRVTETGNRRLQVRMVVVNHSAAELPDMKLAVSLRSAKAAPGDEPVSKFNVTLPSLGAFQSVDVKADTATKLRAYEFPDWQFLKADFEVTSP